MINLQQHSQIPEILDYLRDPTTTIHRGNQYLARSSKTAFVLNVLGELFIKQYRIIEFLPSGLIWLDKCFKSERPADSREPQHILMHLMDSNELQTNRTLRYEKYYWISEQGELLVLDPYETQILFLYLDDFTYSEIVLETISPNYKQAPQVKYRRRKTYLQGCGRGMTDLGYKQLGTLLHEVVQIYIKHESRIHEMRGFVRKLQNSNLKGYDVNRVLHTINYIIGKEMSEGGYEIINVQKLFNIKKRISHPRNSSEPPKLNFNRTDLILRKQTKALVIDWKFSRSTAKQYQERYSAKMQQYLRLAKSNFQGEVEFRLYCINMRRDADRHEFTYEIIQKAVHQVDLPSEDEDSSLNSMGSDSQSLGSVEDGRLQEEKEQNTNLGWNIVERGPIADVMTTSPTYVQSGEESVQIMDPDPEYS